VWDYVLVLFLQEPVALIVLTVGRELVAASKEKGRQFVTSHSVVCSENFCSAAMTFPIVGVTSPWH
jgi:hypothetical protein